MREYEQLDTNKVFEAEKLKEWKKTGISSGVQEFALGREKISRLIDFLCVCFSLLARALSFFVFMDFGETKAD